MTEDEHRNWDILIKGIVTPVIAVGTIWFGVYQYFDRHKQSLETEYMLKRMDRKEKLLDDKTSLYKETVDVVSFLANNDTISAIKASRRSRFWELYWGGLAAVESPEIESLMVQFGELLTIRENQSDPDKRDSISMDMKRISYRIATKTDAELKQLNFDITSELTLDE